MSEWKSESVQEMQQGWMFVMQQAAMLAFMPIEDWLEKFNIAESIGPIVEPSMYRDYIYSQNEEIIKEVLKAALVFKRAILSAQAKIDTKLQ